MKDFDEVIQTVDSFGNYQKLQCMLFMIVGGSNALHMLGNTFYSASADHYCRVYNNQTFTDVSHVKNCTIPHTTIGGELKWSKCELYKGNLSEQVLSVDTCFLSEDTVRCNSGWVYDKTWYENTVVFEYDLVCDKDWMKQLSKSILPVGNLVGTVVFGQISDMYGRKPVYIVTLTMSAVTAIATAFSTSYFVFIIGQFLLGVFPISLFISCQVTMLEMVDMNFRVICIFLIHIGFSSWHTLLGVIAWSVDGDWRKIQLIVGILWVVFLPSILLVTESPRWMMQKHKYDDCLKVLKRIARFNHTSVPDDIFDEEKKMMVFEKDQITEKKRRYTVMDLLKPPRLRFTTILMCLNWFSCGFVYYGIALNTDQIGGNPYTTFTVAGFVEIPARIVVIVFLVSNAIGRRWSLCVSAITSGTALILSLIPDEPVVSVVIAMVAKMCIALAYSFTFVYGMEVFPTVVRNVGTGLSAMSASIGVIISPFIMLLSVYWTPLPFVVMGITSVTTGALVLFLPETKNRKLPTTIEDGETFGTWSEESTDGVNETGSLIQKRPDRGLKQQPQYGSI